MVASPGETSLGVLSVSIGVGASADLLLFSLMVVVGVLFACVTDCTIGSGSGWDNILIMLVTA